MKKFGIVEGATAGAADGPAELEELEEACAGAAAAGPEAEASAEGTGARSPAGGRSSNLPRGKTALLLSLACARSQLSNGKSCMLS